MIQAALALLSTHGYHGMRFEDVAATPTLAALTAAVRAA